METYRFTKNLRLKILKGLLDDEDFLVACRTSIKPEYFPDDTEELICREIFTYVDEYGGAPSYDVLRQLLKRSISLQFEREKEKKEYDLELRRLVRALKGQSVKRDIPFLKKRIQIFAKICETQAALVQASQILPYAKFDEIEALISKAVRSGSSALDVGDFLLDEKYVKKLLRAEEHAGNYIPTGIASIDRWTRGLRKGTMGLVIAATGEGKSMALINIGCGALRNLNKVVHYTLEDPKSITEHRYVACLSKKPTNKLNIHARSVSRFIGKLRDLLGIELLVKEFPMNECTVGMIKQHLQLLKSMGIFPDLVLVDYYAVMKSERKYRDHRFELRNISEGLVGLATSENVALWTAQQGNRAALESPRVSLKNAGEDMSAIQAAHRVLCITRTEEDKEERRMGIFIGKNKGGTANVPLRFREAYEQARIIDEAPVKKRQKKQRRAPNKPSKKRRRRLT